MLAATLLRSFEPRILPLVLVVQTVGTTGKELKGSAASQSRLHPHHHVSSQVRSPTTTQEYCVAYGIDDHVIATTADVEPMELPIGMGVIKVLAGNRRAGGSEGTWYEAALERIVIEYCQESYGGSPRGRYVTYENITAAKDEYGVCIQTLDGIQEKYADGLCEVESTCYWTAPEVGEERASRYTNEQYEANQDASQKHMENILVTHGTLELVLAVAVFVGGVNFAVRRGIQGKYLCEGELQRERVGYTSMEQWTPALAFVAGFVVVSVAASLSLMGDETVNTGLEVMFRTIDDAYDGIQELVSSVSPPLIGFIEALDNSTAEVEMLLSRVERLLGLDDGTRLRLDAFESVYGDRFEGRDAEFETLGSAAEAAGASFVSWAIGNFSVAANVLEEDVLGREGMFVGIGNNVLAALEVTNSTAAENVERVKYFRQMSTQYAGLRRTGMVALISSVLAAAVLGLCGVMAGISARKALIPWVNLLRVTCIVVSITTWLTFALSAVPIVAAVAWSDGCHFLDLGVAKGWATAGLSGQSSAVFDGCLGGAGSIFDAFNFTRTLGFVETYSDAAAEVETFNFTIAITETTTAIFALTDFVDSLNATQIASSELNFYTNAGADGSLLLDPDCAYNISFAVEESIDYLSRPWIVVQNATASAATPWEAGGVHQSFDRQENESGMRYMSRVFNISDCSLNNDLLAAWDNAARERAIQEQMVADLLCISSSYNDSSHGSIDSAMYCFDSNASYGDTISAFSSDPASSGYSLSPCGCVSGNYTTAAADLGIADVDTVLEFFMAFTDNVTEIRNNLTDMYNLLLFSRPSPVSMSSLDDGNETVADENSGSGTVGNLATDIVSARCASRCSFLGDYYQRFDSAMCGSVLSGLAQVGFSMFLLGIGGLVLLVSAGIAVHRLKAEWGKNMAKITSTEEGIVMEEF